MAPKTKSSLVDGSYCHDKSSMELEFELTSDLLGTNTDSIVIKWGSKSNFTGVVVTEAEKVELAEEEKVIAGLTATVKSISSTGLVVIEFSDLVEPIKNLTRLTAEESTSESGEKRSNM